MSSCFVELFKHYKRSFTLSVVRSEDDGSTLWWYLKFGGTIRELGHNKTYLGKYHSMRDKKYKQYKAE